MGHIPRLVAMRRLLCFCAVVASARASSRKSKNGDQGGTKKFILGFKGEQLQFLILRQAKLGFIWGTTSISEGEQSKVCAVRHLLIVGQVPQVVAVKQQGEQLTLSFVTMLNC